MVPIPSTGDTVVLQQHQPTPDGAGRVWVSCATREVVRTGFIWDEAKDRYVPVLVTRTAKGKESPWRADNGLSPVLYGWRIVPNDRPSRRKDQ